MTKTKTKTMNKKDIIALIEKLESELWEASNLADRRQDLKNQWNIMYALKEAIYGDSTDIECKLDFVKCIKDEYTK